MSNKVNNVLSRLSEAAADTNLTSDEPAVRHAVSGMDALIKANQAKAPGPDSTQYDDWSKGDLAERAAVLRKAAKDATKSYRELVALSNFYHRKGITLVDRTLDALHSEIEEMSAQAEHLSLLAKTKKK